LDGSQGDLFLAGLSFSFSSSQKEKETKVNPDQIRRQRESLCSRARKKLDLRGGVSASDQRRLPQIIQQVFRSGPLPKAALSGFSRRPAGP
jgi:hypothetical protein